MANFNFHNPDYVNSNIYIKITKPSSDEVWKFSTSELVANSASETETNTSINLTWNTLARGYPVTLPTALPTGEYDILFFAGTSAAAAEDNPYITGMGFKWDGQRKQIIGPPKARLTSRVE